MQHHYVIIKLKAFMIVLLYQTKLTLHCLPDSFLVYLVGAWHGDCHDQDSLAWGWGAH